MSSVAKRIEQHLAQNFTNVTVNEKGGTIEIRIGTYGLNANSSEFSDLRHLPGLYGMKLSKSFYEKNIFVMIIN